jgi:hypothetical protein
MEVTYVEECGLLFGLIAHLYVGDKSKEIISYGDLANNLMSYKFSNLTIDLARDIDTINLLALIRTLLRHDLSFDTIRIVTKTNYATNYLKFAMIFGKIVYVNDRLVSNLSLSEYEERITSTHIDIETYNKSVALCLLDSYKYKISMLICYKNELNNKLFNLLISKCDYVYAPFIGMDVKWNPTCNNNTYGRITGNCPITHSVTYLSVLLNTLYCGFKSYATYDYERRRIDIIHPVMSVVKSDYPNFSITDPMFQCKYKYILHLVNGVTPYLFTKIKKLFHEENNVLFHIIDLWWILFVKYPNGEIASSISEVLLDRIFNPFKLFKFVYNTTCINGNNN